MNTETSPDRAQQTRSSRLVEAVVPVVAALVVLWATWMALAPGSVWIDDAWVALAVKADSPSQLAQLMVTAHGFMVLLAGWLRVAGIEGVAPQALPLAFGLAAPAALWFGLRRWASWPVVPAGVATLLVATSPLVVTFSSRVKQYTLDVLLAALLTAAAIGLTHRFSARRRWWLTAGACVAIVLSAATATVAGAAVLVAWGTAAVAHGGDGGDVRSLRPRTLWRTAGPVAVFTGFALLWQVLVLSRTIPDGMYTFWQGQFLPLDDGAGAVVSATWRGLLDVTDATIALPVVVALGLVAVGVWRHRLACTAIGAMVVLPVLASIALSALQRAPWGGGRTESHLVVAFAVGIGAAFFAPFEPGRERLRPVVAAAGVLVVVLALAGVERVTYPQEDLRPLLTILEDGIAPDEVILVYPFARLSYALYTAAPVTFSPNPGSSIGYALEVDDPRVRLLPAWRRDPSRYPPIVRELTAGACGLWLPATHVATDDLAAVKQAVAEAGFVQVGPGWSGGRATLSHWRHRGC